MVRPIDPRFPFVGDRARATGTAEVVLADGALPLVLLPVRVETRWFEVNSSTELELRVRIFPDELHVANDDTPTAHERDLAIACWRARADGASGDGAIVAWQTLVTATSAGRAAWLLRRFAPTANPPTFPPLPTTAGPLPTVAAMPERWYVVGRRGDRTVFAATTTQVRADLAATPHGADQPSAADRPALGAKLDWLTSFADAERAGMAVTIRVARTDADVLDDLFVFGVAAATTADASTLDGLLSAHGRAGELALLPDDAPTNHTDHARPEPIASVAGEFAAEGTALAAIGAALGVSREAVRDAARHDGPRDDLARAMAHVIWPTTWGHFLETMVGAPATTVEAARQLYLEHVRPDGAFAALRIRDQPYGVLATVATGPWPPQTPGATLAAIVTEQRRRWLPLVTDVPRLGAIGDLDRELIEVLRRGPRAIRWAARTAYGRPPAAVLVQDRVGAPLAQIYRAIDQAQARARASLDAIAARTPVRGPLADLIYDAAPMRVDVPPVAPADADPARPLAANYLAALADPATTAAAIRNHTVPGAGPRPLLYLLARHALLSTWSAAATRVLRQRGRPVRATVWEQLDDAGADGARDPQLAALRAALSTLATRSVSELARALAGFLDVASHRLDAWTAALASQRLRQVRAARPRSTLVGGWAWLERPRPGRSSRPSTTSFIHAPSLAQARTAAILRAGFDAHQHDQHGPSLALDLTADRVRAARAILDDLRAGQSLGRSLGLWIEAWLTDHGQGGRIGDLRRAVAEPGLAGDPRAVPIDGVRAFRRWHRPSPPDDIDPRLVAALGDRLDAVADLLLADGIHHAAHGDGVRAGLVLDALERGDGPLPQPQIDQATADGRHVRWRVVLCLGSGASWPGTADCARALAAPALDAWAASAIGDPRQLGLMVRGADGREARVTLAQLGLCALDVALTVASAGLDGLAQLAAARLDPAMLPAVPVASDDSDELALIAGAVGAIIRAARPLAPGDLGTDSTAVDDGAAADAIRAALATTDPVRAAALVRMPQLAIDAAARAAALAPILALARTTPVAAALGADLAAPRRSQGARTTSVDAPVAFATWLADRARVRPHLDPVELLAMARPHAIAGARQRTDDGVELVVLGAGGLGAPALVLDDWTEVTPAATATTGVALPFDAPRAQPPQAVLIAVAPPERAWTPALLLTTLSELIDTARLRVVDPARFHDQVLPAIYLPDDPSETVATVDVRAVAVQLLEAQP